MPTIDIIRGTQLTCGCGRTAMIQAKNTLPIGWLVLRETNQERQVNDRVYCPDCDAEARRLWNLDPGAGQA